MPRRTITDHKERHGATLDTKDTLNDLLEQYVGLENMLCTMVREINPSFVEAPLRAINNGFKRLTGQLGQGETLKLDD